jgi:hypothetical protein
MIRYRFYPTTNLSKFKYISFVSNYIIVGIFATRYMPTLPIFLLHGSKEPRGAGVPHFRGFTITLRHTTLGRTPLDELSVRRKDLCLITYNTHKRQTGFEPAIPASERPQTHALDRAVAGIPINADIKTCT